jgi:tight adherence protein B
MRAAHSGIWQGFLVHLDRLRSPLGAALLGAAAVLVIGLWALRRRRARAPAESGRAGAPAPRSNAGHALRTGLLRRPGPGSPRPRVGGPRSLLHRRRPLDLVQVLAPYRLVPRPTPQEDDGTWAVITVPALKRLSVALEGLAERAGLGARLGLLLDRAGARTRPGELLSVWLVGAALLMALGWVLAGLVGTLIVLVLVAVVPPAGLQVAADRRARLFANQLPDVLKLTASSLRAGFSLLQGLEAVTRQLREPSAGELQRALTEARLGRPVEEALEAAAARIRNRDFTESVAAVRIQQEAGGNLASLFDTLATTMVQRLRLRREVRALTAEGRLSAYILGVMPLALGVLIFTVNRGYILELFHSLPGKAMLVGGLVLQVVGFIWMYRIVKIDT